MIRKMTMIIYDNNQNINMNDSNKIIPIIYDNNV